MTLSTATSHIPSVADLSQTELEAALTGLGQPTYRARQIRRGVLQRLATSFEELSDLPAPLRRNLARRYRLSTAETALEQVSADGSTRKALLRLGDGELIETVLMRYEATPQGRR